MTTATKPKQQNGAAIAQQQSPTESRVMEYVPFGAMPGDVIKLTLPIVRDLVAVKTKSGKVPSDRDIIKFMLLCKARRLNPFEGDAYLVGYDGKDGPVFTLITGHQAYLKRAASNPDYDGMQSGVIVFTGNGELVNREGDFHLETDTLVGAWASLHFKTKTHPMTDRVNLKAYRKPFGVWLTDPAGMIVKVAECSVLRKAFPAMFVGQPMEQTIDPDERQGLPEPAREFTPIEQVNGSRKVVSEIQEAQLKAALEEAEGSELLVRDFYGLHHGQKLLASEFSGCLAKIKAGDFSAPPEPGTKPASNGLAEGELPNEDGDLAEYTAEEVDRAIMAAKLVPLEVYLKHFGAKRAADLTQEQRRQIVDEMLEAAR